MSDEIVSCPGCQKKFRIPTGAAASGAFPCTACETQVTYGKGAAKAAAKGAAPAALKAAAPVLQRQAPAPQRSGGSSRGKKTGRERAGRDQDEPEERSARKPKDRTSPMVWVTCGAAALLVVVILVVRSNSKPTPPVDVPPPVTPAKPIGAPDPAPAPAPAPAPTPAAGTATPDPGTAGAGGAEQPASGIGGTKSNDRAGYSKWMYAPGDELFGEFASVEGVTPEERAKLDADAAAFADRSSGASGMKAGERLRKAGRKAIPSLLGVFSKHWKGAKWETEDEKLISFQTQQMLLEITKASNPTKGWVARFARGVDVAPSEFHRAAKIWCAWWRASGSEMKEFEAHKD